MKEIKAYIHKSRIADVLRALRDSGWLDPDASGSVASVVIVEVKTVLVSEDSAEQHYSLELAEAVVNESRLELVCDDAEVDRLVALVAAAAHTGSPGAGWVFVTDLARSVRIE